MKLAIMQPGYLAWLGFFELMAYVDRFVYFDDVQYTRKDWRSRNRVKTANGPVWLSVPVKKAPRETLIKDIEINYEQTWLDKHLRTIEVAYRKAPYFEPLYGEIKSILESRPRLLKELDDSLIRLCMRHFSIECELTWSSELKLPPAEKNRRIIDVCRAHGSSVLYDTQASSTFIDVALFAENGIEVLFQDYQHPQYPQQWGEFVSHMAAIDLIFNTGPQARKVLLSSPAPERLLAANKDQR
ncbi:MAG: WbqC family protein [Deltaproteobacteria bacterium]|nr:WbqC family protein [Deltaproteobacteria bacterium]